MSVNAGLMAINGDHKLEALDAFEDIAASIEKPNGISIAEGMAATGLAYHCFYAAALRLNVMGKIRLIRSGGQIRLIAPSTSYPKEAQLFTSTASTARELRSFLANLTSGLRDGSVPPDRAEVIALAVGAQIAQCALAAKGRMVV